MSSLNQFSAAHIVSAILSLAQKMHGVDLTLQDVSATATANQMWIVTTAHPHVGRIVAEVIALATGYVQSVAGVWIISHAEAAQLVAKAHVDR